MPTWTEASWAEAKSVLNQNDLERLACVFLTQPQPAGTNWESIATDWGSEDAKSMKNAYYSVLRKLKNGASNNETTSPSVKGIKRKVTTEDDQMAAPSPPVKRGRGRPAKVVVKEEVSDQDETQDDKEMEVKQEASSGDGNEPAGEVEGA